MKDSNTCDIFHAFIQNCCWHREHSREYFTATHRIRLQARHNKSPVSLARYCVKNSEGVSKIMLTNLVCFVYA